MSTSEELGPLPDSEEDPARLWAEIHRLRAAVQGPDGYATWQDAAVAERVRRVKAEQERAAERERWRTTLEDASDKLFALREFCATRNGSDYRHIESEVHRMLRALKGPNDGVEPHAPQR
jgi:hypothetical protein